MILKPNTKNTHSEASSCLPAPFCSVLSSRKGHHVSHVLKFLYAYVSEYDYRVRFLFFNFLQKLAHYTYRFTVCIFHSVIYLGDLSLVVHRKCYGFSFYFVLFGVRWTPVPY